MNRNPSLQERLAQRLKQKRTFKPQGGTPTPPRYDEVFFQGVQDLNAQDTAPDPTEVGNLVEQIVDRLGGERAAIAWLLGRMDALEQELQRRGEGHKPAPLPPSEEVMNL